MQQYRYKKAVDKKVGEFKCPYCSEVFHKAISLAGHIGGAHRKGITKTEKPHCKFCDQELVKGKNWADWAVKMQNLICIKCKRDQNRKCYQRRVQKRRDNVAKHKTRLAKLLAKRKMENGQKTDI